MKIFPLLLMANIFLGGCYSIQNSSTYQYQALYSARSPEKLIDKRIQRFVDLYNHLEKKAIATETEQTYAESIYFNDTLITLYTRQELIKYLENTQKRLESIDLMVVNVFEDGEEVFVQWMMKTSFVLMGKHHNVQSIGITHLRFDPNGKIVLHQDYWDSTNGFFQHIPIIGGILQWIKQRLHS